MNAQQINAQPTNSSLLRGFTFSFYMTMAMVASFFPLYFDYKGYSKLQIGMLYSIGPLVGIVSNLTWGFLSDKYRTIKKIMIILLAVQLVTIFFVFQTDWFTLLYITMAVFFFFQQPMVSLNDSQLMLNASQTGKSYASYRVWGSIGFAFAAGFFGWLLKSQGSSITPILSASTIGISLLLAFFLKDIRANQKKMEFGGMLNIIGSKKFLWFLFLIMIMAISTRLNDGFLALYLRNMGASDSIIGFAWMASALSEIPTFFFLSKYGHRYKELPLLAIAGFAYAVRFLLMIFVKDPMYVILIQMLHSVTFGIFIFTAIRYIQQIIPDQYRASGQAIFAVTWSSIAGLISGTLGGYLFDVWNGGVLYLCASILAFIAGSGFLVTHLTKKTNTIS
ncbi:putative nucleoside transporter YegT [compost metagenome]